LQRSSGLISPAFRYAEARYLRPDSAERADADLSERPTCRWRAFPFPI